MARTGNNCVTHTASGKLSDFVLTKDGTMRKKPDMSNRIPSPLQMAHHERFSNAILYAYRAIRDPELNAFYAKAAERKFGLGAWHLAIRDYMNPPRIVSADFRKFKGMKKDEIIVEAYDLFHLAEVVVSFTTPDGYTSGDLEVEHEEWTNWRFRLISDINLTPEMIVIIKATDLPGNTVTETITWPFGPEKIIEFTPVKGNSSGGRGKKSQLRLK